MLNEYRGKNDTLRGLARNKDIATLMRNAVDSPIGSTHRKRVGSVLSVLKKANLAGGSMGTQNVFDGAGGPGVPDTSSTDYSNFSVFPAAPPMNGPGNVDWKNEMNNGAGFYYGTPGQTAPSSPSTALSNPPIGYHPGAIQKAVGGVVDYAKSGNFWTSGGSDVPAKTIGNVAGGAQWFGSRFLSGLANVKDWAIGGPNTPLKGPTNFGDTWGGQVVSGLNTPTEQPAAPAGKMGPFQVQTPVKTGGTTSTPNVGGTPSGGTPETGGTPTGGSTKGGTPTGGNTTGSTSTGGTQNAPSTSSGLLTSALKNNIGPTAFALKAQSDPQGFKQLMKDVAGVDIPDSNLPSGKLLSAQINDIEAALKTKYNLDGLLNEKNSMISTGVTVERDLQAYIRGRDEYLNQTQGMIDDFNKNRGNMDLTVPGAARDAENYVNYLYTLRGNQNQNYIGFINSSLAQYNKELTDVTNNYDTALTAAQHDLTAKAAITTEEYTQMNTMLQEMYNNAEAAPGKKLAADALYQQLHPTVLNTISDGIGNLKSGGAYSKQLNDINNQPEGMQLIHQGGANDGKNGQLEDYVTSIVNTINKYAPNGGQDTAVIVDTLTRGMQNRLAGAKDAGEAQSIAERYMGMIRDFKDYGIDDPNTVAQANQMAESVTAALKPHLSTLLNSSQTVGSLRNAVNSATKNSWSQFGSKSLPSRDQFLKDNSTLPPKITDLLYTWINQYMAANNITDARNIQTDITNPDGSYKKIQDLTDTELTDFVGRTMSSQMFASYGTQAQ